MFRVTTIPEEAATEQVRKFTPLAAYLEKKLGMKVEFTPVSDYPAAVEALVNKKVDLVWFGGFTYVQAQLRSGGKIIPIAQREEDTRFQSVFIAKTDSGIKTLADMKGKQVSFGSQSSTSGHLMPRSILLQAGIEPGEGLQAHRLQRRARRHHRLGGQRQGRRGGAGHHRVAQVRRREQGRHQGGRRVLHHAALLQLQLVGARRHAGRAAQQACRRRCSTLDPATPEGKEILQLNRATRYIPTSPDNYKGIEAAGRSAGLI